MKHPIALKRLLVVAAVILLARGASAQFASGPPGMNPTLTKLFGKNTAFTAAGQVVVESGKQGQPVKVDMKFSMLDGKTRTEMDLTKMADPRGASQMKAMGMDQVVFISQPDQKLVLQVYPGLHGYVETAMPETEATAAAKDYKMEKTSLGKETIDAHACEKNKVTMTDDKGAKHEFIVWNATDLKDFPMRFQTTEQGSTVTISYKDVKLEKPDAKLFGPPGDYTKYDNQMDLIQATVMKRTPAGAGSK